MIFLTHHYVKTIKKVDEIFLEVYFIIFSFALLIEYVLSFASRHGSMFVSASATERTRDFCGLFPLHIAKYAANRCIYSTNLSIPFCAAPL